MEILGLVVFEMDIESCGIGMIFVVDYIMDGLDEEMGVFVDVFVVGINIYIEWVVVEEFFLFSELGLVMLLLGVDKLLDFMIFFMCCDVVVVGVLFIYEFSFGGGEIG